MFLLFLTLPRAAVANAVNHRVARIGVEERTRTTTRNVNLPLRKTARVCFTSR